MENAIPVYAQYFALKEMGYNVERLFGFDTYQGVLHSNFYMRKSLVCDLMEPFRPIIDLSIRKAMNLNEFKEEDFEVFNNRYTLSWKKSPYYVNVFAKDIIDKKEKIFSYIQEYYRAFMKQKKPSEFLVFEL